MPGFHGDGGDMNLGPHACTVGTVLTELSPKPWSISQAAAVSPQMGKPMSLEGQL